MAKRNWCQCCRDRELLTQKAFAEKYGFSLRTVQNWEYRSCMPEYIGRLVWRIRDLELLREIDSCTIDRLQKEQRQY